MNNNLHYHQFQLFYGASDLQNTINESDDRRYLNERGEGENSATPDSAGDYGDFETEEMSEMWERKVRESKEPVDTGGHGAGVHQSILEEGYRPGNRVSLNWSEDEGGDPEYPAVSISDAHHRVAAAADIERTTGKDVWIPVQNYDYDLKYRLEDQHRKAFGRSAYGRTPPRNSLL